MNLIPLPHQQRVIDLNKKRFALFLGTGAGKTFTSLWCQEDKQNILIIVPRIVFYKWIKDIDDLWGIKDQEEKKKGRCATIITQNNKTINIMTKEWFRDKFVNEYLSSSSEEDRALIDAIIVDEAHYFAGMKSRMTKALFWLAKKVPLETSIYLLTATPYLSTPWNIYSLGIILGANWNYAKFRDEMFFPMKVGGRIIYQPRNNNTERLKPYVESIGITIKTEDVIEDLPEQKILFHNLELTEEQKSAINEDRTTEVLPRYTKLNQIENGYIPAEPLDNRPEPTYLSCNKLEWIKEYVKKHPHTAIICRYNAQVKRIAEELNAETLTGETKNREKVIERARSKKEPIVIQASVSEGYELPEIENVIFASLSWSYKDYIQMQGRFLRVNNPIRTTFEVLTAGEIDSKILKAIKNKEDFYAN